MGKTRSQSQAFFSIRKRILIFAVFSTLIPALLFGWISYYKTHELLLGQAEQELKGRLDRSKGELDAWFRQRFDDLGVFSNSFVLANNLLVHLETSSTEHLVHADSPLSPEQQIRDFLQLVQTQVRDYQHLLVLDTANNLVAQYPQLETSIGIDGDGVNQLKQGWMTVSESRTTGESSTLNLTLGVPIVSNSESNIGALVAEIPIALLNTALETSSGDAAEILLISKNGEILLSSLSWKHRHASGAMFRKHLADREIATGLERYRNYRDADVISLSISLPHLSWHLVIEKPYQHIFAEVERLRGYSLLLTLALVAGFSLLAYLVSQSILLPLKRLTLAAATVAKGDLNTRLKTISRDELGFAMTVFNDMVERLRVNRDELKRISVTDSLTGLYNKQRAMDALYLQFERYRRSGAVFSLLMVDVDHFKRINDQHGHQAGDAALKEIGNIFRSILRSIDFAARYGGEEFLIILEQTSAKQAHETAERIRAITEQRALEFNGTVIRFTVSIGVASVRGGDEDSPDSLIQRADRGLYKAKNNGRNQVMGGAQPILDNNSFTVSEKTHMTLR